MARTPFILLSTFALVLCSATVVAAQDGRRTPGNVRFYGGLGVGFGGESDVEGHVPVFGDVDFDEFFGGDLVATFGVQVGADFVVHRFLALGLEYRFGMFNTERGKDDDVDRSKMFDFAFKPRGRYAFDSIPLELYLTVPVGLTIPRFSDEVVGEDDVDERIGWNLGAGAGATYFFGRRLGVNLEPIWLMHRFKADGPFGVDGTFTTKQFNLLLNAVFAL